MPSCNVPHQTLFTGDNLDILRGINSDCVDLIYLDPPYNSNHNYAAPIGSQAAGAEFKDTWGLDDIKLAWHGLIKHESPVLYDYLLAVRGMHGDSMMSYLIYMAVRIMELKRVLKPTGSLYLHCDPTASHYLKLLLDTILGQKRFQSEITWKRNSSHNDSHTFGNIRDVLLFYGEAIHTDEIRVPLDPTYVKTFYRYKDTRGKYRVGDLTAKGLTGGGYAYAFHGHPGPWRYSESRMRELEADQRIHLPQKDGGVPCIKRYLHENKGQIPNNIWDDIHTIQSSAKEKTGYPTQKPLAILERIIKASSNPGDMVLDPFCGCATTCIAAEKLERQWIGMDIAPKAADLVQDRLRQEKGVGFLFQGHIRTDLPKRTDLGKIPPYNSPANKKWLYGEQGGYCNGCEEHFQMQNLTVDHIVAKVHGSTDHLSNLQLLCGHCNSVKGTKTQEELLLALTDKGYIKRKHAA